MIDKYFPQVNSSVSNRNNKKRRPRRSKFVRKNKVIASPNVRPLILKTGSRYITSISKYKIKQLTFSELVARYVPHNLLYLISTPESPFYLKRLRKDKSLKSIESTITIPGVFSLCDNMKETIYTLKKIIYVFFC